MTVTVPPDYTSPALELLEQLTESWAGAIEFVEETDEQLIEAIERRQVDRVRYATPERVPLSVLKAAAPAGACVVSRPVVAEARLECLWYLHEQSISIDYHRYGNLGDRSREERAEVD